MLLRFSCPIIALILILVFASPALALNSSPVPEASLAQAEGAISVSTSNASNVTTSSAMLNGFLSSLGPYESVVVYFEWSNGSTTEQTMSTPGPFSHYISGLSMGTSYSFRAVALAPIPGGQKAEGTYISFTTQHSIPEAPIQVETSAASSVTHNSALLHGYLSSFGSYSSVRVWFEYGTSTGYGANSGEQIMSSAGAFSIPISGLNQNTTYYFRAVAMPTVVGVSAVHGSPGTFTTSGGGGSLSVSTGAEADVTTTSATIIGYLNTMGGYQSANVWFQWGPTTSYGQITSMQTMYSPGMFNANLQGLTPGKTYHFRALAVPTTGGGVTVNGFDSVFSTSVAPSVSVSTGPASQPTASSATVSGYLNSMGSSDTVYVWFEYGTDTTFGNTTAQQPMRAPGNFTTSLTGLLPGLTYYFRAAAFSNGLTTHGQQSYFRTTSASPVTISTNTASSINTTTATLNGNINSMGTARSVQIWFDYGTTSDYGMTSQTQTFAVPGSFSSTISGLVPGTTYYFQAVGQTPDGAKAYGNQDTFTTVGASKLAVTTYPASSITSSTAVLNGFLSETGGTTFAQVWFEYGPTTEFGNSTSMQTMSSAGSFSGTVTGLKSGLTYYCRAVALNPTAGGRSVHGDITSFVTTGSPTPTPPSGEIPAFIWLMGAGFVIIIIILIILIITRR
ncbi:MAG: hypothetical protein PHO26_05695 [Dehalococcoidia bacterium]|nr:hypothetical protein [Dehalococcoidia bacterium]MDD5493289.1 hypothetical protein [Dehalococcoidia bacterium]